MMRFNDFLFFFFFGISDVHDSCIIEHSLKYPQLSLKLLLEKTWIFGYYFIPNNILDKTHCNFYPYIRSERVSLAIIFWILYMFFYLYIKSE